MWGQQDSRTAGPQAAALQRCSAPRWPDLKTNSKQAEGTWQYRRMHGYHHGQKLEQEFTSGRLLTKQSITCALLSCRSCTVEIREYLQEKGTNWEKHCYILLLTLLGKLITTPRWRTRRSQKRTTQWTIHREGEAKYTRRTRYRWETIALMWFHLLLDLKHSVQDQQVLVSNIRQTTGTTQWCHCEVSESPVRMPILFSWTPLANWQSKDWRTAELAGSTNISQTKRRNQKRATWSRNFCFSFRDTGRVLSLPFSWSSRTDQGTACDAAVTSIK